MAGIRKDVELIFRGEDQATPTIKGVRKSVADLTAAVEAQVAAAERGEGSIDELAKAYKALDAARGDIGEITRIAAAYERQGQKLGELNTKVQEAVAKHEALQAKMAETAAPSKRLQNEFAASERRVEALGAKQRDYLAELNRLGAALDEAGGDSKNFAATQESIRTAALETARALRDAATAMDQFKGKQGAARATLAAQDEATAFNQLAAGSGLPQAQIAFISQLENRLEALQLAIREDQASMAAFNAELRDRAALDAEARIRAMAGAMDQADQAAQRLKVTMEFRSIAAEIEANAREIGRFGAQTDTAAASGRRLAQALDAILNPTQAAARTMDGVNQAIAQSETVVEGAKRRMSEYNAEINNLQAAVAGLQDMARLIDSFRNQESAVAAAKAEFEAAQTEVLQLAAAIRTADEPTQEMVNALKQAEARLETTGAAMQKQTTKLAQLEASLEAAKIDVNNLALAENGLTAAATRAAAAQGALRAKTSGAGNFLGLNPMELQNIGFQLNDIVVGLASGQRPLTVFLQQGLQIGQTIPGAFAKIVRFGPQLAILAAVLFTVGSAIAKVNDEAEDLKLGEQLADQSGGQALAADFAELSKALRDVGVEAEEVREILLSLQADGLNPGQMEEYIAVAKDMAEVTGVEIPEAIATLREAFQGGIDDIIALDDQTNAYTESEIALIQQLFEQGKADEARAVALAIYSGKMEEVAAKSEGPWSRAIDELGTAWDNFLGGLANLGPIRAAIFAMDQLGQTAAYAFARLAGKGHEEALKVSAGTARRSTAPAVDLNRRTNAGARQKAEDERALAAVKATTRAEKEALVVAEARQEAADKKLSTIEVTEHVQRRVAIFNAEEDKKDAKRAEQQAKRDAAAGRRADAAAKRAARQAEAEARRIEAMEEALVRSLEQLDAKVAKQSTESLERRLSAIDSEYEKLFRSIDEFAEKTGGKGLIGDRTIEQAKEHVRFQQQQLKNYETLKFHEERINDLMDERNEKLDLIKDKVARGIITPEQGLADSKTVIDDMAVKINEMAQAGLIFAQSIRGAKPDPALDALIAKFETAMQNNSAGQNVRSFNDVFMETVEQRMNLLNQLQSQRNQLIDLENLKVQMGLQTQADAQRNIMQHYAATRPLILQHIQQIRALAASYGTVLTPEMQAYFDALEANIQGIELQAQGVDASFTSLRQSINQILTTNIVGFIDEVARSFADLASGKGDVMDFFANVGRALLSMIGNILLTVGQLIITALILRAVDKATGGILKPLLQVMAATVQFNHEGGIAGESNHKGQVNPAIFANAPRYHGGGIAGLASNEVAAVLKRGEEVLTEDDPRHVANGGMNAQEQSGMGGSVLGRAVLAVGDDEIARAVSGSAGEKVFLYHLTRNKATIRQILES